MVFPKDFNSYALEFPLLREESPLAHLEIK